MGSIASWEVILCFLVLLRFQVFSCYIVRVMPLTEIMN